MKFFRSTTDNDKIQTVDEKEIVAYKYVVKMPMLFIDWYNRENHTYLGEVTLDSHNKLTDETVPWIDVSKS